MIEKSEQKIKKPGWFKSLVHKKCNDICLKLTT